MIVLIVSAALLVVGLALALAFGLAGRVSVHAAEPVSSAGGLPLGDGPLRSGDLDLVRFDTAVRGYRMDQVDAVLDRLQMRLSELERESGIGGFGASGAIVDDEDLDAARPVAPQEGVGAAPGVVPGGEPARHGAPGVFPIIRRHEGRDDPALTPWDVDDDGRGPLR